MRAGRTVSLVVGGLMSLLPCGLVLALDIEVHPGKSIRAAINQAVAGDRIIIYGQPGYEYDESLELKEGLIVEGRDNPVLRGLTLKSGAIVRGLTLKGPRGLEDEGAIVIGYNVQHATVEDCVLRGHLMWYGSGNIVRRCIIRGQGTIVQIFGGNNSLSDSVLRSTGPFYEVFAPLSGPVLRITSNQWSLQVGGNNLWGNTIYGWGTARYGNGNAYATGIQFYGAGLNNRVWDTIIANSGIWDIEESGYFVVSVTYSLLEKGTDAQRVSVSLGAGVLTGKDARFVSPGAGDFRLTPSSPAVDAGDPEQPLDPDGTRGDMGALPLDQRLTPANPNEPPRLRLQILQPDLDGNGTVNSTDQLLTALSYGRSWPPTLRQGGTLSFFVKVTDPDPPSLIYGAENLPVGACFNGRNADGTIGLCGARQFVWRPNFSQSGNYPVTFTAINRTFIDEALSDHDKVTLPITVK